MDLYIDVKKLSGGSLYLDYNVSSGPFGVIGDRPVYCTVLYTRMVYKDRMFQIELRWK